MTVILVGLGLEKDTIPVAALEALRNCDLILLENYTVDFPYSKEELEKTLKLELTAANRDMIEGLEFLEEAKKKNVGLLVYGDALSATTHITIVEECRKQGIECKVFHNASILVAISETGLQLYKFGKTASMPSWKEHTNKPTSFMKYIQENKSIKAHTLLLTDIGLDIADAMNQLTESSQKEKVKLPEKIIACSNVGTDKQKIFYDTPENLKEKEIPKPFCLIIPDELHFVEKAALESIII
jgi:diphthine synthase